MVISRNGDIDRSLCLVPRGFPEVFYHNFTRAEVAGIYVHIPFCRRACNYCDFHFSTRLSQVPAVLDAIGKEITLRKNYLAGPVESVYFGGGTPSLLEQSAFEPILAALAVQFGWAPAAEITLEANPEDINASSLGAWRSSGINRLSIGLQSFDDSELRWMNRCHTAADAIASVKRAQDAGLTNISIDLIYGSRFQSLGSWEKTLETAIGLNVPHVSAYHLTVEKGTALGVWTRRGTEPFPEESLGREQFIAMSERLGESGFEHYEISNFARPGSRAVHNSSYWAGEHYLGIGPSAHSFNGESRQWNFANNNRYLAAIAKGHVFFEKEKLSTVDKYNEYVLTRLRLLEGCRSDEIRARFGTAYESEFLKGVARNSAYFLREDSRYYLATEGRLRADGIASDLFVSEEPSDDSV